ncbi:virulence factor Mce-like protein [Nocardia kruczakiae]|uniref:Virulence factor Mce-like protein n=1 Tax=Nocardia kruczakiae TaxID=261477 RepID=A0ABU1XR86_9NOCA|nr:MlaD family protein [Nocardia kruczakiae]MDR7172382.1 virulence factor Mce-like protein [Nocardia kruczakiae]
MNRFLDRFRSINWLLDRFQLPTLPEMWDAIPSYRQNRHLWLGIGAGTAVIALVSGVVFVTGLDLGHRTVRAEFAQAAGLRPGNSVDVAGIDVGTVASAHLAGDRIVAELKIRPEVRLGPDATAAIKMSTILGKMHVELHPGNGKGLPGNVIRLDRTEVPYNLDKVVNDPKYTNSFEHLEKLDPAALRASLDAVARQMGDSPQLTAAALDSVGVLADVISDRRDEVDTLLKNIDSVATLVDENRNGVLLLLTRGRAIGDAVAQRQDLVKNLLDNIATISTSLQQIGAGNNGQLGPLIRSLDTMSQGLQENRDNLDHLYQTMPVALRQVNNTFGNGPYGEVYLPWGLFPDNWLCATQAVAGCR